MYNQQNRGVSGGRRVALLHRAPSAVQGMHPIPVLAAGLLCCCPSAALVVICPQNVPALCPSCALPCVPAGPGFGLTAPSVLGAGSPARGHCSVSLPKARLELSWLPWHKIQSLIFCPIPIYNFCEVIFGLNPGL